MHSDAISLINVFFFTFALHLAEKETKCQKGSKLHLSAEFKLKNLPISKVLCSGVDLVGEWKIMQLEGCWVTNLEKVHYQCIPAQTSPFSDCQPVFWNFSHPFLTWWLGFSFQGLGLMEGFCSLCWMCRTTHPIAEMQCWVSSDY